MSTGKAFEAALAAFFCLIQLPFLLYMNTESVNFLGLEVFLAPSTAWAARNQPRTPKN